MSKGKLLSFLINACNLTYRWKEPTVEAALDAARQFARERNTVVTVYADDGVTCGIRLGVFDPRGV